MILCIENLKENLKNSSRIRIEQDTRPIYKNQLYFCSLATNSLKMKLRKPSVIVVNPACGPAGFFHHR